MRRFKLLKDTMWHPKGTVFVQYRGWTNTFRVENGGKGIEIVHYPADLPKNWIKQL